MKTIKRMIVLVLMLLLVTSNIAPSLTDSSITINRNNKMAYNYFEQIRYDNVFEAFINKLGFDESRNNWKAINQIGAIGEFQFIGSTLKKLGYEEITANKFKQNPEIFPPELQRRVLQTLIQSNINIMKRYIDTYQGRKINGVLITKAGIIAACHLAGPGGVMKYLKSNGLENAADINGANVERYMRNYQAYNLNIRLI